MKLTPWFSAEVKPVRKGVYERSFFPSVVTDYSYWNGKRWGVGCESPEQARRKCRLSTVFSVPWRGRSKP